MRSVRLTTKMRGEINQDLLRHRFSDQVTELVSGYRSLALDVYNDIYSQRAQARMRELPKGWLGTSDSITVEFDSGCGYVRLEFSGDLSYSSGLAALIDAVPTVELMMAHSHRVGRCVGTYQEHHPLCKAYQALNNSKETLITAMREASMASLSALNSVSTLSALIAGWPAIEPFAEQHKTPTQSLPMISVDRLNNILGLPLPETQV